MRWRFSIPDYDITFFEVPYPLTYYIAQPIGWADIIFTLKREKDWHGVFFEYSLPLKFYDDPEFAALNAYSYLKFIYEKVGIEGFVLLKVEMACSDTDPFTEEGIWRLNFTSYEEDCAELCTIQLNLEPENCLMTFKNRYDQKVDLDSLESYDGTELDDYIFLNTSIDLEPKGLPVVSDVEQVGTAEDLGAEDTGLIIGGGSPIFLQSIIFFHFGYNQINVDEIINFDESVTSGTGSVPDTWVIDVPGDYTLTLESFLFSVNVQADTDGQDNTACGVPNKYDDLLVEVWTVIAGVATTIFSDTLTGCLDSSDVITIDASGFAVTTTLAASDTVRIYVKVTASGTFDTPLIGSADLEWTINYNQTGRHVILSAIQYNAATPCDVFLINETGSRILESITDDCMRMLSDYYGRTDSEPYIAPSEIDGCGSLRALTTGLFIRQRAAARFNLSFKEFFENLNAIDNIGIGLEDDPERVDNQVIRVEPMEYFYTDDLMITLDHVPMVKITVLQDEHFSIYKFGYQKWEAEEYTGLDEFATKREYRTNISAVKNTLDKTSAFIASGYAIEITRLKHEYSSVTQSDWRFDNDPFIICVKREDDSIVVEQGNITSPANLIDPDTVYNWRISPNRNALRWLKTVLASYRDVEVSGSSIKFTNGEGNYIAEGTNNTGCVIETGVLSEDETLNIDDFASSIDAMPVYRPELWELEYPLSFSEYQNLKSIKTGIVRIRYGQHTEFKDFYLRQLDYKPNEGIANWKLLPKLRSTRIDECCLYYIQLVQLNDTATIGDPSLIGAELSNLFFLVNGELLKYNDLDTSNNEIVSWDTDTGFATTAGTYSAGRQISIIHIPTMACSAGVKRFEGHTDGDDTIDLGVDFTGLSVSQIFVYVNGELQKYNDTDSSNNEIPAGGWDAGTHILTLNSPISTGREVRAFAFI